MATFKELKTRLQGKTNEPVQNPTEDIKKEPNQTILELEEARYLLSLIAKSDFSGKDIQIVYNVAFKLQKIMENIISNENG